jgi:hypothetical protein
MQKILVVILLLLNTFCFYASAAGAGIPEKYYGVWDISHVEQQGFPWWTQIKYPVKLSISSDGARMVDQFEYQCSISKFRYDSELDVFVFVHCGVGQKSEKAFEVMHVVSFDSEGNLQGSVRNYKDIFKWRGVRALKSK